MEQEQKEIRTIVWNEGEQIPEDELVHIWEHFYRLEKSRQRDSGGTGIGLAIVRQIVQLHKGTYSVRNTGNGVEFCFTLFSEVEDHEG
jgi:two-component system sensor histidine kinase VanS